ncbi:MAG: hypothetical protein QNJ05_14700 [Woeseiaceae bacterium]|nr:hypothetical protein [Woeseiaceae bacterium]
MLNGGAGCGTFFAGGFHDELLSRISRIRDLNAQRASLARMEAAGALLPIPGATFARLADRQST